MKLLSKTTFETVKISIYEFARPLERALFENYFEAGSDEAVLSELTKFQNDDGGFGHGIESDFRLPLSSPMATSVGIRILSRLDYHEEAKTMIKKAIGYLEASLDSVRIGWYAVPQEVNNYPHAFWWHYNEAEGMSIIDYSWGNPSAELIAYCYKYRDYLLNLDVNKLIELAIDKLEAKEVFKSENEIFCYIKLYEVLPVSLKEKISQKLPIAISQVIIYDEEQWHDYIPRPVDFVKAKDSNRFGVIEEKLHSNLDYIINQLESEGRIIPPWGDVYYQGDLKTAYNEWIGVLTLKALMSLDKFDRIAK